MISSLTSDLTPLLNSLMGTQWIYPLIAVFVFLDCLFPFLPSEMPLNLVGAWSAATGTPNIWLVAVCAYAAVLLGDNTCYFLGSRLIPLVHRVRPGSRIDRFLGFINRHMETRAGAAIVAARFIPSARFFMTVTLGAVKYPWRTFFFFDAMGALLWLAQALGIGYAGGVIFRDNPLLAGIIGIVGGVLFGLLLQKVQQRFGRGPDGTDSTA